MFAAKFAKLKVEGEVDFNMFRKEVETRLSQVGGLTNSSIVAEIKKLMSDPTTFKNLTNDVKTASSIAAFNTYSFSTDKPKSNNSYSKSKYLYFCL